MRDVITLILGGGRGTRLRPLTAERAKPAVPFGGKYRLIDIPVSNCIHAGLKKIYVLTQFMSDSLHNHIMQTYHFDTFSEGFVHILAAQETPNRRDWFQGTADAVRRCQPNLSSHRPRQILILSGDQIYQMDFKPLIEHHRRTNADLTIGTIPVSQEATSSLGILKADKDGWITKFVEKPQCEDGLCDLKIAPEYATRHNINGEKQYLGSMGVYVFESVALASLLTNQTLSDFGKEIIPLAVKECNVQAFPFTDYWCDVGSTKSYYDANIAFAQINPPVSFRKMGQELFTHARHLPPAKVINSKINNVIIAEGASIRESDISNSVIGVRTFINSGCKIKGTVMLGQDFYEEETSSDSIIAKGLPPIGIGKNCVIERAIIDKGARIGDGCVITNKEGAPDFEGTNYWVRDGIVVIPRGAVLAAGTKI